MTDKTPEQFSPKKWELVEKARSFLEKAKKTTATTGKLAGTVGESLKTVAKTAKQNRSKDEILPSSKEKTTLMTRKELQHELENTFAGVFYGDLMGKDLIDEDEALKSVHEYYDSDRAELDTADIMAVAKTRADQEKLIEKQREKWLRYYLKTYKKQEPPTSQPKNIKKEEFRKRFF